MMHASMLKTRRKNQARKKQIHRLEKARKNAALKAATKK